MYIGIILLAGTVAAALLMLIGWALGRYSRAPEIARARTIANSELAGRRSNLVGHWARIGVVGVPSAVWRAGTIIWPELSSRHLTASLSDRKHRRTIAPADGRGRSPSSWQDERMEKRK